MTVDLDRAALGLDAPLRIAVSTNVPLTLVLSGGGSCDPETSVSGGGVSTGRTITLDAGSSDVQAACAGVAGEGTPPGRLWDGPANALPQVAGAPGEVPVVRLPG